MVLARFLETPAGELSIDEQFDEVNRQLKDHGDDIDGLLDISPTIWVSNVSGDEAWRIFSELMGQLLLKGGQVRIQWTNSKTFSSIKDKDAREFYVYSLSSSFTSLEKAGLHLLAAIELESEVEFETFKKWTRLAYAQMGVADSVLKQESQ